MKYIYIDLGAYNGDTYLAFMARQDLPVPPEYFGCYLFEPNPKFKPVLSLLQNKLENIVIYSQLAAWTKDTSKQFAVDTNELAYGSTLMPGKTNIWDHYDKIKVKTFDVGTFLEEFKDDYVIVKMDVEGAEFPILEHMLDTKQVSLMDELWIELHPNKVVEYTSIYADELIEKVKQAGVKVTLWH